MKIVYELIGGGMDGETIVEDDNVIMWEFPFGGGCWKYERRGETTELVYTGISRYWQ
jgi:hypothetical protein